MLRPRLVKKMFGRRNDISDYVYIDLSTVKYIELWQETANSAKVLAYHTLYGSFIDLQTLGDASLALKSEGFTQVDPSTIIQYPTIKDITDIHGGSIIYFIDGTYIFVRKKLH